MPTTPLMARKRGRAGAGSGPHPLRRDAGLGLRGGGRGAGRSEVREGKQGSLGQQSGNLLEKQETTGKSSKVRN